MSLLELKNSELNHELKERELSYEQLAQSALAAQVFMIDSCNLVYLSEVPIYLCITLFYCTTYEFTLLGDAVYRCILDHVICFSGNYCN